MRKLILRCGLSLGDIVMLTAAVRDLHRCYPGRFLTDVRTFYPELWENNPHVIPLSAEDPNVKEIDCSYPLINKCNKVPYHCLHGFVEFLNERLGLRIRLSATKGHIHLSNEEKSWCSQVHELTGQDTPFWIVAAGGKYDVTIKWWETARYQQVVEHFRRKIVFVQVGRSGHHHPKLDGVIDLRGKTDLRQLLRLIYHSQGVLCPITALMHLAAAVETKPHNPPLRPCVVLAGGREPAHWESYPGHQFIHLNGALPCCSHGGCWKDRTVPLRDGDPRDRSDSLCVDVTAGLPRCMDLVSPEEVMRRIEFYYTGRILRPLSAKQQIASQRGIRRTTKNPFDRQPLNLQGAGLACDEFVKLISSAPPGLQSRGIVICGGGIRYFTNAWVCINMLRRLSCHLPIQLWHLGDDELDSSMEDLVRPLGVECVDACKVRLKFPARILKGWALKPYSILHSPYKEVLFLDSDNVPVINPEFLFETPQFNATGAIFWPDYPHRGNDKTKAIWRSCGLRRLREPEFETGQIVVDKERCWQALCLSMWFNENCDFYYRYIHGDKETFHLAFRKIRKTYSLIPTPAHGLDSTMCQHDFEGRRVFQHRNTDKWDILLCNREVKDFWFEDECRKFIHQLRATWDGRLGIFKNGISGKRTSRRTAPKIVAVMISCPDRDEVRRQTFEKLTRTDWGNTPVHVQMDQAIGEDRQKRQTRCAFLALKAVLESRADYILFLEDDLDFNRHIQHNLQHWEPLRERRATLASLYNPGIREAACDLKTHSRLVDPGSVFGSQAFLISVRAVNHILNHWHEVPGMQDIKMSRLAGRLGVPLFYHAPSLVQHVGKASLWGARFHQARDFDQNWKA